MKKIFMVLSIVSLLGFSLTSCTPLLVGSAAIGGAYAGYTFAKKDYMIHITKPVKGKKIDNLTRSK